MASSVPGAAGKSHCVNGGQHLVKWKQTSQQGGRDHGEAGARRGPGLVARPCAAELSAGRPAPARTHQFRPRRPGTTTCSTTCWRGRAPFPRRAAPRHRVGARRLCFVIRPGGESPPTGPAPTDPWQYVWLGFLGRRDAPFSWKPRSSASRRCARLFESLRDQCPVRDARGRPGLRPALRPAVVACSRDAPPPASRQEPYAAYAKAYLETSYMQPVSIQKLADTLHIDRRYLTVLFREAYGEPPRPI